jgi:2'-5' RNA ligase
VRLFVAIAPDAAARAAIDLGRARLESSLGASAAAFKWVRAENVHITVHFLGEVSAGQLDELRAVLDEPLSEPVFHAISSRLGAFPDRGPVRVIWRAVEDGAAAMGRIHTALAERLRRARTMVDDRPFTPHLTLARARDRHSPRGVREALTSVSVPSAAWQVTEVTLFRSDLSGPAPRYDPVVAMPLARPRSTEGRPVPDPDQ